MGEQERLFPGRSGGRVSTALPRAHRGAGRRPAIEAGTGDVQGAAEACSEETGTDLEAACGTHPCNSKPCLFDS